MSTVTENHVISSRLLFHSFIHERKQACLPKWAKSPPSTRRSVSIPTDFKCMSTSISQRRNDSFRNVTHTAKTKKRKKNNRESLRVFTATSISYCQQWHVVVQAGNKQLQFGRPKHVLRGYLRLLCFFKKRGVVEETGTGGGGALTDTFIGLGRWFRQRSIKGRHRKARYLWGAVVSWPENSSAFHLHFVLREVSELNVAVRDHAAQTHTVGRRGGGRLWWERKNWEEESYSEVQAV